MTVSPAILHVALTFYWSGAPMQHLTEAHRKAGFGKPDEPLSILQRMGAINTEGTSLTSAGREWIERLLAVPFATHAAEPAPVAAEPVAWMRKWAFEKDEGTKGERPHGWKLQSVTENKLLSTDVPLYPPRADLAPTGNTALVEDQVIVPRSLIASACHAIVTKRDAPNTLTLLRNAALQPAAPIFGDTCTKRDRLTDLHHNPPMLMTPEQRPAWDKAFDYVFAILDAPPPKEYCRDCNGVGIAPDRGNRGIPCPSCAAPQPTPEVGALIEARAGLQRIKEMVMHGFHKNRVMATCEDQQVLIDAALARGSAAEKGARG